MNYKTYLFMYVLSRMCLPSNRTSLCILSY